MFKVGLIGCGRIGSEFDDHSEDKSIWSHAGAYSSVSNVNLTAACDLKEQKLRKCGNKWNIPNLYTDYKKMLAKENLDILSICTLNSSHLEIIIEAVQYGVKAIFCEKPMAESLKDADEMINLCANKHILLQINHQRRFDELHQEIKNFLNDGRLGKIQQVSFYYTGGIANTGSHMFDLFCFFFGEIEWIQAIYSENKSPNPRDPNVDGILKFKNGVLCAIQACETQYFWIFELDCLGSQGRLKLKNSGRNLDFWTIGKGNFGSNQLYKVPSPIERKSCFNPIIAGVKCLVDCLETNTKSPSSGEEGRAALELICASLGSANSNGKRIKLPLKTSKIRVKSK